ncbi:MAG: hypothetical protein Q9207_004084 [Kuettlingeria erythrocarpa]
MSLSLTYLRVPKLAANFNTLNAFAEHRLSRLVGIMQALVFNFTMLLREMMRCSNLRVPSVVSCWLELMGTTTSLVQQWILPVYRIFLHNGSHFEIQTLAVKGGPSPLRVEVATLGREIRRFNWLWNQLRARIQSQRKNHGLDIQCFGLTINQGSANEHRMSRRAPSEMVLEAMYRTHGADGDDWYELPKHLRAHMRARLDRLARVVNGESWAGIPRTVNILFVNGRYVTGCSGVQYPEPFGRLSLENVGPPSNTVLAWSEMVRDGRFQPIEKQLISARLNLFRAEIQGVCTHHASTRGLGPGQTWEIFLGESMVETLQAEKGRRGRAGNFAQMAQGQKTAAFDGLTMEVKAPCIMCAMAYIIRYPDAAPAAADPAEARTSEMRRGGSSGPDGKCGEALVFVQGLWFQIPPFLTAWWSRGNWLG